MEALYVPLKSNAHGLLTGSPVDSLRRKLKFASLFYEYVCLEDGMQVINAGETGSSSFHHYGDEGSWWQTPHERGAAQSAPLVISVAPESSPGVLSPGSYRAVSEFEPSISWRATLRPFAEELSGSCGWFEFVEPASEVVRQAKRDAEEWIRVDKRNGVLENKIQDKFARSTAITGVNQDLAFSNLSQIPMISDKLHSEVVEARLSDPSGWRSVGFSLPVLYPDVSGLGWPEIAELRQDQAIRRLRGIWKEVEDEALEQMSPDVDVEFLVNRIFEAKICELNSQVPSLFSGLPTAVGSTIVFGGVGYLVAGLLAGGLSAGVGLALPAIAEGGKQLYGNRRARKKSNWQYLHQRLRNSG